MTVMWKMADRSDMGKIVKAGWLILAMALASCRQESVPDPEPDAVRNGKRISVSATFGEESRTSIRHDDEAARYVFQWEAGDRLAVVEAVPASAGNKIAVYDSDPLPGPCDVATFSLDLPDREIEGGILYLACYPTSALQDRSETLWDGENQSLSIPLVMPDFQFPSADSFDPEADVLVSKVVEEPERPDGLLVYFARLGTILKMEVTGLDPGTLVHGGTLMLGYRCQGAILYDAAGMSSSYPAGADGISFRYTHEDAETGQRTGTPLIADDNGKVTVWLRLKSGIASRNITLLLDTEDAATGEAIGHSRFVNLQARGKTITFKEGGLTTLSVSVSKAIPGDGIIPRDLKYIPAVYVDTPRHVSITSKETWLEDTRIRIFGDDNQLLFEDVSASIRGRGNTTWYAFPKKPYYFKLKKKNDLLGTGKSKKYNLLANWFDRTLLRNVVAFEAARCTNMEWTPSGIFVELYLNGQHQGNYLLCEKVEVEDARIHADYLFSLDTSVDPVTFQDDIDFYTDGGYRVNTAQTGLPVEVKYPDRDDYPDGFDPVLADAKNLFDQLEQAISDGTYPELLDMDSFCDWYLVHELTGNTEPNHPKSSYLYVRDGKFYAGPVWDFDWETYLTGRTGLLISQSIYYRDLLQDATFLEHMRERWKVLKPQFQNLYGFIDSQADWIRTSEAVNHSKWPIQGFHVNQDETMTFQEAVDHLKLSIQERIVELDKALGPEVFKPGSGVTTGGQEFVFFEIEEDDPTE